MQLPFWDAQRDRVSSLQWNSSFTERFWLYALTSRSFIQLLTIMPRALSYTPSWLTRPSAGYDLFASVQKASSLAATNGTKVPTNGQRDEEGYRGPRRTIAYRGTEVYVVVDNQIRWSDLSMLKENWEGLHRNGSKPTEGNQNTATTYKVWIFGPHPNTRC